MTTAAQPVNGSRILAAWNAGRQAERQRSQRPMLRAYDAAKVDDLTFGWTATNASADQDILMALARVRGRSRNLAANNDYMKQFLRMVELNVIGPNGFVFKSLAADPAVQPRAAPKADELARVAIEGHYEQWSKAWMCDVRKRLPLREIFRVGIRATARDGETLIRRIRGAAARNPYGYALQILDIDRLDENYNGEFGQNRVVMGVEIDDVGAPVAYHLLTSHPGGSYTARNGRKYERVTADQVFHFGLADRPEANRYMPWGHTAMLRMEMLGKFQTAAVVAARKGAETVGFLKRHPDASPMPGTAATDAAQPEVSVPGTWDVLPDGYEPSPYDTKYPDAVFGTFVKDALRGISAGLNVAYNALANDLEHVNYSSIRAGTMQERDGWMEIQKAFIDQVASPVFLDWLDMALLGSAITMPNGSALPAARRGKFAMHRLAGRRWTFIDPKSDGEAAEQAVLRGWTTDAAITAERGGDWEANIDQLEREAAYAREHGVPIGQAAAKPQPTPAASSESTP